MPHGSLIYKCRLKFQGAEAEHDARRTQESGHDARRAQGGQASRRDGPSDQSTTHDARLGPTTQVRAQRPTSNALCYPERP